MTRQRTALLKADKNTIAWNGRLERDIYKAVQEHAKATRRTIGGQINFILDDWLQRYQPDGMPRPMDPTPRQLRTGAPILPTGGSEPPRRIQQLAAASTKNAVAPDVLKEIAESQEGWEGSDPKKLLAGTKG